MERDERIPIILQYVKDKDVLDVGCIDHNAFREQSEDWLHGKICKAARNVLGVDNKEEEVKKLQNKYNIICADAQTMDLNHKFECVVAGELLEHLENPGMFLRNMLKHLLPGGCIILTTPNPFYPTNMLMVLLNKPSWGNYEHICWYCGITLSQLLKRVGFNNIQIHYVSKSRKFFGIGGLPARFINKRFAGHLLTVAYNSHS